MADIGMPGFLLILIVALLLFGPKKLPELGHAFGRTIREFKSGMQGALSDDPVANPSVRANEAAEDHKQTNERLPD